MRYFSCDCGGMRRCSPDCGRTSRGRSSRDTPAERDLDEDVFFTFRPRRLRLDVPRSFAIRFYRGVLRNWDTRSVASNGVGSRGHFAGCLMKLIAGVGRRLRTMSTV